MYAKERYNRVAPGGSAAALDGVVPEALMTRADRRVISLNDPRVVFWDVFLLLMLFYQCWSIPFQIGVSGGHLWTLMGVGGLLIAESINAVFVTDTILYFFRETRDGRGARWRFLLLLASTALRAFTHSLAHPSQVA